LKLFYVIIQFSIPCVVFLVCSGFSTKLKQSTAICSLVLAPWKNCFLLRNFSWMHFSKASYSFMLILSIFCRVGGHNGPVLSLSNKLLGEDSRAKFWQVVEKMVLFVVRLWSLSSSGRHDQRALKATLYGLEKPVDLFSVAGYVLIYFIIHCWYIFLSLWIMKYGVACG